VPDDLPTDLLAFAESESALKVSGNSSGVSREDLVSAIERAEGNKSKAAKLLGVNRKTLYRKMHQFGVPLG
jgi:transcriptional regulator of acetoin/glycerol metabolism